MTPGDAESLAENADGNTSRNTGRQGTLLRLSGLVDLESRLTVGCAGAVLTYLQRRKAVVYLPGDGDADHVFRVCFIETFSLAGFMYVGLLLVLRSLGQEFIVLGPSTQKP